MTVSFSQQFPKKVPDSTPYSTSPKTMPTLTLDRDRLMAAMGHHYSDIDFEQLCFRYGVELDEVTTQAEIAAKAGGASAQSNANADNVLYKIEIPANRYDLLCMEGLVQALRVFQGEQQTPMYRCVPEKPRIQVRMQPEVKEVRPFVAAAILRNVHMTQAMYDSFIDLQEKLHQNIGRRRQLVSMGTHDLDTMKPPFEYAAPLKSELKFVPLFETQEMDVNELFEYYQNKPQSHIRPYLHLTEHFARHPVIRDSNNVIGSLPPIINSEHSKITLSTKNIFIDVTGQDWTKVNIVLNMLITGFSLYCAEPYTVEPVEIVDVENGTSVVTPSLSEPEFLVSAAYLNRSVGLNLSREQLSTILQRMQLRAHPDPKSADGLIVRASIPRTDILHACDIREDVAISYGYNNLVHSMPQSYTIGVPNRMNKFSDQLREVVAQCGFTEVLTFVLSGLAENFDMLRRSDDNRAVMLANSKSAEFQIIRTSLLPGLLKTLNSNIGQTSLPVHIFEVGDVAIVDVDTKAAHCDTGARNYRRLAALYCDVQSSGFEIIHGLLDCLMESCGVVFEPEAKHEDSRNFVSYYRCRSDNPTFFEGRRCDVVLTIMRNGKQQETTIATFGTLHPEVLKNFNIAMPASALELDIESLLLL